LLLEQFSKVFLCRFGDGNHMSSRAYVWGCTNYTPIDQKLEYPSVLLGYFHDALSLHIC
jgi:hypothetical protein